MVAGTDGRLYYIPAERGLLSEGDRKRLPTRSVYRQDWTLGSDR
jgi:hypothetical protein